MECVSSLPWNGCPVCVEYAIRALIQQLPVANLSKPTELAVWLALATCCRIGELTQATWQNVNLELGEWLIPAEHSKNGRPHTGYLSDFGKRHLMALHALSGTSLWCFPNRDGTGHIDVKTVNKQLSDRQRGDSTQMSRRSTDTAALILPGGKWTPHDLRRTGATMMTSLGVLPEVAEKCLNHTEEKAVRRIYQRYSYDKEKGEAWRLLGERLDLLTSSDKNIVTMSARKARKP